MKNKNNGKKILAFLMIFLVLQAFGTLAYYYKDFKDLSGSLAASGGGTKETSSDNASGKSGSDASSNSGAKDTASNSTSGKSSSDVTPAPSKRDPEKILTELNEYIAKEKGTYGIYFKDLTTDEAWGINDEEDYVAASTKKVPINLYAYSLIVKGKLNPAQKLTYTKSYYEGGTGSIQYKKTGTTFTIKELQKLSITVSDNIATNMLISKLGRANIASYMQSLVTHPVDASKNISSPKDMSIYLAELLDFQKEHPTEGDEMIYNMEHTVFNDRIPKELPKEVVVAHKIGTQVRAIHDVGIVYAQKPYIICIMSKDVDEKRAPAVLARISKMIYDYSQEQE